MSFFKPTLIATAILAANSSYAVVTDTSYEDIADSAVWQSSDQQQSLLIATLEGDGIAVYDAQGRERQRIEGVEAMGADVRYGIQAANGARIDIAAIALPDEDAIGFYRIDPESSAPLTKLNQLSVSMTPEGVCLGKNATTSALFVAAYDEEGTVKQYKLGFDGHQIQSIINNTDGPLPVRITQVGGELSACAIDDATSTLYVAEQNVGIWVYGADPENVKDRTLVDVVAPIGQLQEIEDMDILYSAEGKGALVVADEGQGFLLYDRESHAFINKFAVDNIEEAKLITTASNQLWLGNTELDAPVYQTLSWSELKTLSGYDVTNAITPRQLEITGVELVPAKAETKAVANGGDAADDPALWINQEHPEKSLIIATNKKGGLMAYNLSGEEVQYLEGGRPNNVDLRQDLHDAQGNTLTLAAASNRDLNTIVLYTIDGSNTPIKPLPVKQGPVHSQAPELLSNVDEVYGLCMSRGEDGTPYVFVNGKDGQIEQWRIDVDQGVAKGKHVRTLQVATQPEGCVVDDATQTLYVGEEDHAIWSFDARPNGHDKATLFAKVDGEHLIDDIEGLTLYQSAQQNLLIASSQGNNTYAVFDLNNNGAFVKSFAIVGDDALGTDGATDTDGIHAVSANLGKDYPNGLFIAQDWYNIDHQYQVENQNFKIVDWDAIKAILK